jgi:multiple sugar transport system substrate-binding protein
MSDSYKQNPSPKEPDSPNSSSPDQGVVSGSPSTTPPEPMAPNASSRAKEPQAPAVPDKNPEELRSADQHPAPAVPSPGPPSEKTSTAAPPPWTAGQGKTEKADKKQGSASSVSTIKEPIFKKLIPVLGLLIVGLGIYFLVTKFALPFLESRTGRGTSGGKEITLNYWGLWEPEEVIKPLIEEYQEKNPNITIDYIHQSHKDYRERLQSALAKGEEIDIFRYHLTWTPMLQKDLAPAPDAIGQTINLDANYFPTASEYLKAEGQTYGIPLMFDSISLFYNTKIFKEAGKTPPQTWEELRRTALDLTVKDEIGRIQIAGVALGTTNNIDHFSDILGLMMLQNGVDLSRPTGVLAEDALRFYTIFTVSDKVWDETLPASTQAFANEKLAMLFAPSWRAFDIRNINPNLEFRTVPAPQLPETKVAWATYWAEGVSAKSQNQQAAWEFLQFLSSKDSLKKLYTNASKIRDFGEPYPRKDMVSELESDPIVGAFVKQGSYAQTWYLSSATHDNGINDRIINYFKDAVNETLQTRNVSTALETASQGVTQVLNQYQVK